MGLTDDQKAMLRLLAQREEGYEDMAALMGISVEELRGRVKEALAEVDASSGAERPAAPAEATPPAVPQPPATAEPPAESLATESAPAARPAAAKAAEPAPPRPRRSAQVPRLKLPKDRGALIGLGAGALVVLILVIVLLVGGGDGDSDSTSTTDGSVAQGISATAEDKSLTQAILTADDGSEATGQAIFGRFRKRVLLQVTAEGLEPSADGESYAVWLSHTGKAMVPVGTAKVDDSGELAARFEVPSAVLVLVARGAFDEVNMTRAADGRLSAAIAQARKTESESTYTGTPVMSGTIVGPLVGAGGGENAG